LFEQIFKNIDDTLWKDAGCSNELDYVEQTSWILFLKYLDDLEQDKETEAALTGKTYTYIIRPEFRWEAWAVPKTDEGRIDHLSAKTGDDLLDFVNGHLFPYLQSFKQAASNPDTIEYKIGEIFGELKNKIQSGYTLRGVLDLADQLRFRSSSDKLQMSFLYEEKIRNMGNAGRNRAIVKVVAPQIGETIYDGAAGSAGFLTEAYEYLKTSRDLSTTDMQILQKKTFYGKEKKSLAYIIGTMNMILHGIEAPNIVHTNTLTENLADIQDKDRFDVILANPPFGGKERAEVQHNFLIKTGETAFLFLQHFIKRLKAGGRAGVVIKNTFLSNSDNAAVSLRRMLLESCDLHTVLDLPAGVFSGAGVRTVVLFFEKGKPTKKIWYYQLDPGRTLGKTNPLNDDDLVEFVDIYGKNKITNNSWLVDLSLIDEKTWDLSVKNPNNKNNTSIRNPLDIIEEMSKLDNEVTSILDNVRDLL